MTVFLSTSAPSAGRFSTARGASPSTPLRRCRRSRPCAMRSVLDRTVPRRVLGWQEEQTRFAFQTANGLDAQLAVRASAADDPVRSTVAGRSRLRPCRRATAERDCGARRVDAAINASAIGSRTHGSSSGSSSHRSRCSSARAAPANTRRFPPSTTRLNLRTRCTPTPVLCDHHHRAVARPADARCTANYPASSRCRCIARSPDNRHHPRRCRMRPGTCARCLRAFTCSRRHEQCGSPGVAAPWRQGEVRLAGNSYSYAGDARPDRTRPDRLDSVEIATFHDLRMPWLGRPFIGAAMISRSIRGSAPAAKRRAASRLVLVNQVCAWIKSRWAARRS